MTEFAFFASQDGSLAYRDVGPRDGAVLVLLHSGFVDSTQFDNLVPRLVELGCRVVAPDARGHGRSDNASRPFRQTDDLADLLRHLGLRQVVLVGVSMGAMIAVDTALEHPELVRALVISGRGIGDTDRTDPWAAEVGTAMWGALASGDLDGWLDGFLKWIPGPDRSLADIDPELVGQVREMGLRTMLKHTADEPDHSVPVGDVETRVKDLTLPILAVDGAADVPGHLATVTALLDAVPNGRRVLLDGVGHYTSMEAPAEFTRVLDAFVRELDQA
ncbi:alpha/beta fold hydrolase [Streptacidiphilus melanogenes]|uniref:alpha/beta fold hydrolase n=1 Tax=Streptacidiphilus melanogenes TaxID=411235 RepID=UPI0005AAF2B9|nr:alpha/beta hydrolase [Streptacidiphilus melanogenes]